MIRRDFLGAMGGGVLIFAPKYGRWFRETPPVGPFWETVVMRSWQFGAETVTTTWITLPNGIAVPEQRLWRPESLARPRKKV